MDNSDVLFDLSSHPALTSNARFQEVTQDATPQLVWQMDTTGHAAYRSLRIPSLYPGVTW